MNKKMIGIIVMMLLIAAALFPAVSSIDNENNNTSKTNKPLPLPFFLSIFNGDWDYWTSSPDMFALPDGNVGIGTISPSSRLEVDGVVHSTSGGFKFPDGTTQISANVGEGDGYWNQDEDGRIYYNGHVGIGNDFTENSAMLEIKSTVEVAESGLQISRRGDNLYGSRIFARGNNTRGIEVWAYGDDAKGIYGYAFGVNARAIHAECWSGVALEVDGISQFDDVVNINEGLEAEGTIEFNDVVNINDGLEAEGTSNFNDVVNIKNVLHLQPMSRFPTSASNGDLVVVQMNMQYHIYCYLNGEWKQLDN